MSNPRKIPSRNARGRFGRLMSVGKAVSGLAEGFSDLKLDSSFLTNGTQREVEEWVLRAATGQSSTIVTIVCPDYETKVEDGRRVYTFDGLGEEVGLVAQRAVEEIVVPLNEVVKHLPATRFVLAMADMEGDEPAILERVGCDRLEFLRRLEASQRALQKLLRKQYEVYMAETPLLVNNSRVAWKEAKRKAKEDSQAGRWGRVDREGFEGVRERRLPLYERFAGEGDPEEMFQKSVLQYIAAGWFIQATFPNPLVLGADSPSMGAFSARDGLPILYLKELAY